MDILREVSSKNSIESSKSLTRHARSIALPFPPFETNSRLASG